MRQFCCTAITFFALVAAQAASTSEFPFQFREGLLWAEVKVRESEKPLNFLVDTGSGVSAINLSTAHRLGLKLGQKVSVQGVDTRLTGFWQQQLIASVGDVDLPREYLAVDLERLSRSCPRPLDGLIGADFFRGRVVQIDFDEQKIRLLPSRSGSQSGRSLSLEVRPCGMRVCIGVNQHVRQWVRLDTGCATALQWVRTDVPLDRCEEQMAVGLAEISIPQCRTRVRLGEETFTDVPTGLHQSAIFQGEAGLLGNGLLSRFSSVTIDAKRGRLVLGSRTRD